MLMRRAAARFPHAGRVGEAGVGAMGESGLAQERWPERRPIPSVADRYRRATGARQVKTGEFERRPTPMGPLGHLQRCAGESPADGTLSGGMCRPCCALANAAGDDSRGTTPAGAGARRAVDGAP